MSDRVHRDVTASGVRLRVAESGDGPPVVLLHGLFVDHTTWDATAEALSDDFHVIAPDLPGFGTSEKPPPQRFPYAVDTFAEAVADLYAGLGLGRAAIVGHGLGGAVALTLAARHPELVSRLVLLDPLCYQPARDVWRRLMLVPLLGSFLFRQLLGQSAFAAFFRDSMVSDASRMSPARINHYYEMLNTPAARGSALATVRSTADTRPIVAQIPRIQAETLVAWGRADRLYPAALGHRLAREVQTAGLQLLDAGHCPQEECPDQLAALLRRFIRAERPSLV